MITGTVRSFDVHKGYGFIKPDDSGVDVLVDICAVERAKNAHPETRSASQLRNRVQ
jgi:cold shock CspA family protein